MPPESAGRGNPLDPVELFGRSAPLEIDVGCASGHFLVRRALQVPEVNLLGIEKKPYRVARSQRRAVQAGADNVRVVGGMATEVLDRLPEGCAQVIHIYFPDPWPKRRHASRRLWQADFALRLQRVLVPEGEVRFITDDHGYWQSVGALLAGTAGFTVSVWSPEEEAPGTEFGLRFQQEGRPVQGYLLRKARPAAGCGV